MDNEIQIFDNYLEKKNLNNLKELMLSDEGNFQWYFSPCKVTDGDGIPQFIIGNGREDVMIEVSQDPEGNGGGFLFISEVKQS